MPSCSVKWCPNHTSTCSLKNGVSFHRFPKDEATCKKWVEAVRFERRDPWWTSSNASRVCSIHFKESDISSTPCKVNILAKTAVPICTMVWFDDNENNVTLKPSIVKINTDKTILKTYERKKDNIHTKLLETSAQSKTVNLKEGLGQNSVSNISLEANVNLTAAQKKSVLTELNQQIFVQSCTEKCCKSEIHVKLNDNTSIILDEAQNNDNDTIFEESNKVIIETNTRICENVNKVNLKEFKSNENKEPNRNSNSDMLTETTFNANISKTFVGKMLKTYLPKRKAKINEKNIRLTSKFHNKTKDELSVTTEKGLNKNKLFDKPKIKEKNERIQNAHTESNKTIFNEFITNQPRIDNNKEIDTVYNEIISELFETPKNVANVSTDKYQETNKNMNSALDKGKNNMNDITNVNTELNMDLELCNVVNSGLNDEINTEVSTDKTAIHGSFSQFNENTVTESNQPLSIMNKNMNSDSHHNLNAEINQNILTQSNKDIYYNEYTNKSLVLTNNESQNLESSLVKNIDRNTTKKDEFTELKKCLSRSKLDFSTEMCINIVKDIATNLSSKYNNNMSTVISEENIQVPDQDHNSDFDKNIANAVNDLVHGISLQDINTDAIEESDSNVKCSEQLNTILIQEFIANKSLESNNTEKIDFITNFNTIPNTTGKIEFNKLNISNINIECNKTLEKDIPDLNLDSCMVNIGCNDEINIEFNTEKTDNTYFTQHNEKTAIKSNKQLPIMNKNIPLKQSDYTPTEMNGNITTQSNKNAYYNENITNNATILSNNELQNLEPSVVDNKFNESKKHLEYNAEFDKKSNIDVNNIVTAIQNNINNVTTREIESNYSISKQRYSNLDKELMNNISSGSNSNKNVHVIDNLKKDPTTIATLNKNMNSDNNEYKKFIKNDMPELNTVILSELNKDQVISLKEEFHHLNTEILNDKDLLLRKSDKHFLNVLTTSDNQQTVVNEHMDVVNSILNRDLAAEFDLSLLLSDIPDDEIQNVDNNSNYNSLDGIGGSPNWIQLPTGEIPKIIDDLLDQDSFFENLDLFDKVNKFNRDKEANKKDKEIKKLVKEKYSTSNVEQFEKQIINNLCETGKQCAKNSISDIEKQLIAEFSDFNETRLGQSNNIYNENKVSQSKKVIAKKCYDLCDEQTDKQTLKQCGENKQNQIVDEFNEQNEEIQIDNKTISECQKQYNVESKPNQIGDPEDLFFIPYFKQREKLHEEQFGLAIDNSNEEVLSDLDIFDQSKKRYDKQSNEQYKTSIGKLIAMEESTPKSKIHNQDILGKKIEINKLSKDLNEKIIEEDNYLSHKAYSVDMESVPELNIGKLKRVIFEECYDSECQNNCKHRKHNSNTESHKKEVQRYEKEPNYTPYDLLYKQQCDQSSIDNLSKQLNDGSSDQYQYIKQMRKKDFLERPKLSLNVKYKTKYKKIAIDHIPGQYLELRWKESLGKSENNDQEGYKRKYKDLGLKERLQRKIRCSESTKFSQQIMAECPECGYTTDDNDLMNYQNDVDLRITKPLSLINKDMLISLNETENNKNNNRTAIDSVFAIELAYVTAIQALERKLKQKIAISEYRLRRVNELSKINNKLIQANINRLFS